MKIRLFDLFILISVGLLFGENLSAMTETHVCKKDKGIRRFEIVYDDAEKKLPCKVLYKKGAEAPKEIYSAQNEPGFCEKKAEEFAEKLTSEKWNCALGDVSTESTPPQKVEN